jgi:hypothetical protein
MLRNLSHNIRTSNEETLEANKLRLGAQSVTLLSTLGDPTQLR